MCLRLYGAENHEVQVHHIRDGAGAAQRSSDFLTVPLCWEHHQGSSGVHGLGVKGFYTRYKINELDLLADTIQMLTRLRHGDYAGVSGA